MPRHDGPTSKSLSRRLNVRVAIYAPPDPTSDANRGDFGEVTGERRLIGYDYAAIVPTVTAPTPAAGKLAASNGYTVEMRRRALGTDYQLDVLTGSLIGTTLFVQDVGRPADGRGGTITVLCQ
jgi:hypothetical protein